MMQCGDAYTDRIWYLYGDTREPTICVRTGSILYKYARMSNPTCNIIRSQKLRLSHFLYLCEHDTLYITMPHFTYGDVYADDPSW